jgi:hypothetical protein
LNFDQPVQPINYADRLPLSVALDFDAIEVHFNYFLYGGILKS